MNTKEQIVAILHEVKPTKNLENITDIIDGGYIDSFELMSLVMRLNEVFSIEISLDDLVPENFNSAEGIGKMVERLKA